jgi:hypothetical protein
MSSLSEDRDAKPAQFTTIESGFAPWSSKNSPDDPYKDSRKLRDNYKHIGDAYDRNQESANAWEIKEP